MSHDRGRTTTLEASLIGKPEEELPKRIGQRRIAHDTPPTHPPPLSPSHPPSPPRSDGLTLANSVLGQTRESWTGGGRAGPARTREGEG